MSTPRLLLVGLAGILSLTPSVALEATRPSGNHDLHVQRDDEEEEMKKSCARNERQVVRLPEE